MTAASAYSEQLTDPTPAQQADYDSLGKLLDLFNIDKKRQLERHCNTFVVTGGALAQLILAGRSGLLAPLLYAGHHGDFVPEDVQLNDDDYEGLSAATAGPLQGAAKKAFNKIVQTSEVRRLFSAHLFYWPDHRYWYLFYFDQRDRAAKNNHWRGGSHIHLVTDLWPNLKLADVWQKVGSGDLNFPNKIHLRYATR